MPEPSPAPAPGQDNAPGGAPAAPGQATDWRAGLPEDIRGEKTFESIKGKDWTEAGPVLAKNYVNAQKMIGGSVRIPGKDAKPEEIAAFRQKLGVPETPDKYSLKSPDPLAKVFVGDIAKSFYEMAHREGYTPQQAQSLLDWYGQTVGAAQDTLAMSTKEVVASLKQEWGGAYDQNLALAQRAVREAGGQDLMTYLDETGLGNHPALVRAFARMGALMAEDGLIPGEVEGVLGAEDARAKIAQVLNDPNDLYHAKHAGKVGHPERVAEITRLFQIAHPNI